MTQNHSSVTFVDDAELNQHFAPNLLTWFLLRGINELSSARLFGPLRHSHSRLSTQ
ncbi:hypothetical protein ACDA63_01280 [Uliginosibacterium sp. sgz301328]|uniref:hypothetical protein n=1 Tax=Uliginosibacterium sp. sgz301328 TaxID=3243764 RepID=UPI00359DD36B